MVTPLAPRYLVDRILPSKRVHLLAGISSSGKSRFLLPSLVMWAAGLPILGLRGYPVPWAVVCADRPIEDIVDTIESMGFEPSEITIIPAFGIHSKSSGLILEAIQRSGAKLVLWEGFDFMVKNPNNPSDVKDFLNMVGGWCQKGLTVIGTVGVAKLKPHEMYQNPRQLVAGSSIWERATSTNFVIQSLYPKDIADPRRVLYVSLKNAPSFAVLGRFDENGLLGFDDWDKLRPEDVATAIEKARHARS